MTQPIDRVSVEIVPNFSGFETQLNRVLDRVTRNLERELQRAFERVERAAGDAGTEIARDFEVAGERAEDSLRDVGDTGERELDRVEREARDAAQAIEDLDDSSAVLSVSLREVGTRVGDAFAEASERISDSGSSIVDSVQAVGKTGAQATARLTAGFAAVTAAIGLASAAIALLAVAVLPTLTGLIVSLTAALLSAAGVIAVLPAGLTVLGAAFASVTIGLQGFGDAIDAVISGDPDKIAEALENLAPAARSVAREFQSLLPQFDRVREIVQQALFEPLQGDLTRLFNTVKGPLTAGLANVAASIGGIASEIASILGSAQGVETLAAVFETVSVVIETLRPAIIALLPVLLRFVEASLPFVERLAAGFASGLLTFTEFLDKALESGQFTAFLESAFTSLEAIGDLLLAVLGFFAALITPETIAAGQQILGVLTQLFQILTQFLTSEPGKRFLNDIGNIAVFVAQAVAGWVIGIGAVIVVVARWQAILVGLAKTLLTNVANAISGIVSDISGFGRAIGRGARQGREFAQNVASAFTRVATAVGQQIGNVVSTIRALPGRVVSAIGNLGSLLFNAGRSVVRGLINGIRSMFGRLRDAARDAAGTIRDFFPFSPAREGPLSGSGNPELSGAAIGRMISTGLAAQEPLLRRTTSDFLRGLEAPALTAQVPAQPTTSGVRVQPSTPEQRIVLEIRGDGTAAASALIEVLSKAIRVRGGDVQLVLGKQQLQRNGATT